MENCESLLRDASMEAWPSHAAAAPDVPMYAEGKGAAASAAFSREQHQQGKEADGASGEVDMRSRIPSQSPKLQRYPWTAPRARKTRRRGDSLEEQHGCRVAAGAPGAPQMRERRGGGVSIAKPARSRPPLSTFFSSSSLLKKKSNSSRAGPFGTLPSCPSRAAA